MKCLFISASKFSYFLVQILFFSSDEKIEVQGLTGVSDMLDGIIARKTNSISEFGAKLDTISDFVFLVASMIKLLPIINIAKWLWVWIVVIAVIKIFNIIFGFFVKKNNSTSY